MKIPRVLQGWRLALGGKADVSRSVWALTPLHRKWLFALLARAAASVRSHASCRVSPFREPFVLTGHLVEVLFDRERGRISSQPPVPAPRACGSNPPAGTA